MQAPKEKEQLIDCRVMCNVYRGYDGKYYRRNSIVQVPRSWVDKATVHEAGHPEVIIDRPLKPMAEERAAEEAAASSPENTKPFEAEVARREGWSKLNKSAEEIMQKDQMEAAKRALINSGAVVIDKK